MAGCAFIKGDGERCRGSAIQGSQWCWNHDPSLAEVRRRNARKGGKAGGRGRPQSELAEIKREIRAVISDVLSGALGTGPGAVSLQGYNTLLRACEVQRRTFDVADLVARLDDLEQVAARIGGNRGA